MDNIKQLFEEKIAKLKNKGIVLMNVPVEKAVGLNAETIKTLQFLDYKGIYVTLSKDYQDLSRAFQYSGVDMNNLFCIDCISRMYGMGELDLPNIIYAEGPMSLEAILKDIAKAIADIKGDKKFVFFDSITAVLLYNSLDKTLEFTKSLIELLNKSKTVGVIEIVSMGAANEKFVQELSKLSDEIITL